jgi:hypothetical protein
MESGTISKVKYASHGPVHTVFDESTRGLILLAHQAQVKRSTVSYLVVGVIKTTSKKHVNTRLDFRVLLANTKLGQRGDSSGAYNGVL